jgi:uncharacterized protein YndB with AHSA1/START domain
VSAGDAETNPARKLPGSITTVHRYDLPLPRQDVWSLISEVSQYRRWWPWLRVFDAAALAEGEEWRCEVQPPVPYAVRFRVAIEHIEAPVVVRAKVSGDVIGEAVLSLEDGNAGCWATLRSSLAPGTKALQLVSRFARPVARFGHDWVLDSGARQFITRAVEPLVGDETA